MKKYIDHIPAILIIIIKMALTAAAIMVSVYIGVLAVMILLSANRLSKPCRKEHRLIYRCLSFRRTKGVCRTM